MYLCNMNLLWNIFLSFAAYLFCRVAYVLQNWELIGAGADNLDLLKAFTGSLLFDTSAICYTLGIYILAVLLPHPVRSKAGYQNVCKWYFIIVNAICIVANLADSVYFPWSGRRSTIASLIEFQNESALNLLKICGIEALKNWWLLIIAAGLITTISLLYKKVNYHADFGNGKSSGDSKSANYGNVKTYILAGVIWLAVIPLLIGGIRGGFTRKTRPIGIGYAMRYVSTPAQAAAILNTPFTMIRNISARDYKKADYMPQEEIAKHYSAVHKACEGMINTQPNVFIIIVESLSEEFMGAYNDYPGYTPFLDSLHSVSLSPREAFANGNKSIDALPSILASVPRLEEHIVTTQFVNDKYSSVVTELAAQGYSSAFFHGGSDGSMGFDAFAAAAGCELTYSLADYCADKRFNGRKDFDGLWAIWDEEFLQYTVLHTTEDLKEPFVNTVFTASSHHPFIVPQKHRDRFNHGSDPMHNCVSYTDYSLQKFFKQASHQPWYANTIFVITADHTSTVRKEEKYLSDPIGDYRIPIFIFDPSGRLPRGTVDVISQQTDIFPTVMGIVGAQRDYIAFGKDILHEEKVDWAYFYNEIHTLKTQHGVFSFDGEKVTGSHGKYSEGQDQYSEEDLNFLKAFIQDYKSRIVGNKLNTY